MLRERWFSLYLLIASALLYFLGAGIARYLGYVIHWNLLFLGLIWIYSLQVSATLLRSVRLQRNNYFTKGANNDDAQRIRFLAAATGLAFLATFTLIIYSQHLFSITIFGSIFTIIIFYTLLDAKYDFLIKLIETVFLTYVIPLLSFTIQSGKIHPLIVLNAFHLTFIFLSSITLEELSIYTNSNGRNQNSLVKYFGFRRGILFHNICVVFTYFSCALLLFWGLPYMIYLPIFFTIPISVYYLWKMNKIFDGEEPKWFRMKVIHTVLFFSILYLPLYGYWTR